VQWPASFPLRSGPGDSVRWLYPPNRWMSLEVATRPSTEGFFLPEDGRWMRTRRFPNLTFVPEEAEAAHRWSLSAAPASLPAAELKPNALAERLSTRLRGFAYTTENPSGRAANPLQDFLEQSQAGHCEYFASALAFMLRSRGVPARVVNGYRLGPWSAEGGYFLVTQDQAHAWVEYYDADAQGWRAADPTPPAPPAPGSTGWRAAFSRWADAAQYRWDRYVVRFSDDDQVEGLAWIKRQALALPSWRPGRREAWLAGGAALLVLLFAGGRRWARPAPAVGAFHPLRTLRPLVRRAGVEAPPRPGETARAWLLRLAALRPGLAGELAALAAAVDAAAYGDAGESSLKAPARALARAWKKADGPR
jgi:hypothetical protein